MLADDIRSAYERRDVDAFAALLAEDVTWGAPGTEDFCRNRDDVLAVYRRLAESHAAVHVVSALSGPAGVVVHLQLAGGERWQAMLVRGGLVAEIRGYDDAASAAEAVGGVDAR